MQKNKGLPKSAMYDYSKAHSTKKVLLLFKMLDLLNDLWSLPFCESILHVLIQNLLM